MGIRMKMMIEMATKNFMDILKTFDENRTIGSITKKEIKKIMKEQLEQSGLDKMLG